MPDNRITEGSIRQRPNGSWEARYTAGYDLNGRQIQKSVYAPDERSVRRKLRMALAEVEMGQVAYGTGTLGEWLDTWMKDYKFRALEPITYSIIFPLFFKRWGPFYVLYAPFHLC